MTNPHITVYLEGSRGIVAAAEAVADAVASDAESREDEIETTRGDLLEAIARTEGPALAFKGFVGAGASLPEKILSVKDQLTLAVVNASVAKVLFAASDAIGEQGPATGEQDLRRSVESARAHLVQLQAPILPVKGFAGENGPRFASGTIDEAKRSFQAQVKEAVGKIVDTSDSSVSKTFETLAHQKDKILEALSKLQDLFSAVSENSVLIRKAWEKLRSALETVRRIADSAQFEQAQHLRDLLDAISVRGAIQEIFQTGPLLAQVDALQPSATLSIKQIDGFTTRVFALEEQFAKTIKDIKAITAIAAPLLSLGAIHFTGPFAALAVPACYTLSLAAILGLGLDFTHAGHLNSGVGIRVILNQLQP